MTSITSSPGADATVNDGLPSPLPVTGVPKGVVWSTLKKVVAPAVQLAAADRVTTMLAVPDAGALRYHISARVLVETSNPRRVKEVPP